MKPIAKTRKISYVSDDQKPMIRLHGDYLTAAGMPRGKTVNVLIETGKITISLWRETPAHE